jgi:peptide deformylase
LERVSSDVAELIQHELDHLDGILFTDRLIPAWGVVARELRDVARPQNADAPAAPLQPLVKKNRG